jgi:hypothetical protein
MNELIANPFGAAREVTAQETAGGRQSQARELAETQTKYLMAERFPRDEVKAMDRILNSFSRAGLAERSQYQFSRGGTDITGPSIHAAQAIAQGWGNMEIGWRELARGIGPNGVPFSEVEAFAVDLQGRVPSRIAFIVPHWRDTKSGGYKLKDERDIYELCANQAQRRKRACILSVVPTDVVDTAMAQAATTLTAKADTSPEAMAKMLQAFGEFGVTKEHIEKRIQRRLDAIQPAQVVSLKRIYASLRDDMSSPGDWFEIEAPAGDGDGSTGGKTTTVADIKGKGKKKDAPPPAPAPAAEPPAPAAAPADDAGAPTPQAPEQYVERINKAKNRDAASETLAEASSFLDESAMKPVKEAFDKRFPPVR